MANQFASLPAPAGNGSGAPVDVSTFGGLKTISYANNGFRFPATVTIEFSNEFVPTNFTPLKVFGIPGEVSIPVAAHWMRATVSNYRGGGAPVVSVGGDDAGTQFSTLTATAGNGNGAGVDVSDLEAFKTIHVATAFRGVLNIEASEDGGVSYSTVCSFYGPGYRTLVFTAEFMRVTRAGVPGNSPGLPIVNVGASAGAGASSGITVEDEGAPISAALFNIVNFTGAGVSASDVGGVATVNIPGGISGVNFYDEGVLIVSSSSVNFAGAGVVVTNVAGVATVTIPGGTGGAGTINRVAKWTAATTLGDTEFPIDDAANALTMGDNQALDVITVNGRMGGTSTDSTTNPFSYAMVAAGGVTGSRAAIRGDMTGTFNTTTAGLTVYGLWGDASATKSAGANNLVVVGARGFASGTADDTRGMLAQSSGTGVLAYGLHSSVSGTATTSRAVFAQATGAAATNIGVDVASSGGTLNIGYRNTTGDNYFNSSSGNTGIGIASGTALSGKLQLRSTGASVPALVSTWGPTAGTSTGVAGVDITTNGTYDTTGSSISATGIRSVISATRSAGASNLFNIAARFSATNGQVNTALQTDSGDVVLNGTAGVTTIGFSSATATALTVSGTMTLTSTSTTNTALILTDSAVVTADKNASSFTRSGTSDSTAGNRINRAISAVASTTRSAGANTVNNKGIEATASGGQDNRGVDGSASGAGAINYGGVFSTASTGSQNYAINAAASGAGSTNWGAKLTATGATANRALETVDGAVLLNTTSGTTTIGFSQATASALTVSGTSVLTSTNNTTHTLLATLNSTAGTTTQTAAMRGSNNATYDATAGNMISYGLFGTNNSTRSAGANTLTAVGVVGTVSGASQASIGVQGQTTATGTTNTGVAGTATGAGTTNIGLDTTATSATTNIALRTVAGDNYLNATSGNTAIGVTSGGGISERFRVAATPSALTTGFDTVRIATAGTFDTTAGVATNRSLVITTTSTRSAGANNLTNTAAFLSASGAQINRALDASAGDVLLNSASGNTTIGAGSTTISTLNFTGRESVWSSAPSASTSGTTFLNLGRAGTFDTTSGVLTSRGLLSGVTSTRSAGANALTNTAAEFSASGAQTNIAIQTTVGNNYFNTTSGNTGVGYSSGATLNQKFGVFATGFTVFDTTVTTSAATSVAIALTANNNGTYDTTSGAITSRGGDFVVSSTRSAGANSLTNRALRATATSAQVNIALQTDDGSNYLNTTSGSAGVGYASAAALPGKLSALGTASSISAFSAINTTVAVTGDSTAASIANNGTYDATAAIRASLGVVSSVTSTRSAGANNLTNTAARFTASGAQVNIALETQLGDTILGSAATNIIYLGGLTGPQILNGTGSPNGVITAPIGSLYLRRDGGVSTSLYVNETGTNLGWVPK
jgi:hypothetical protein